MFILWSLKEPFFCQQIANNLLGAGVLGDGLGTFRDGVFGQFSGEEEPDSSLDLPGSDGGPLVVVGQFGSLRSNTLKQIIDGQPW